MPTFPISRCHRVPRFPTVCQGRLLHDSTVYPCCPSLVPVLCTLLVPIFPIGCAHCVQKLPMSGCLCRLYCPRQCAPCVPKLPTAWCQSYRMVPREPIFPSHGALMCLCSPCQGAIVCLCRPLRVPLVVPKIVHSIGVPPVCQGSLAYDTHVCKVAHLTVS